MSTNTLSKHEQLDALASHYGLPTYSQLLDVLTAMRRCPGVWQTDQETGETFGNLIDTVSPR
jgi:hypothetical protein